MYFVHFFTSFSFGVSPAIVHKVLPKKVKFFLPQFIELAQKRLKIMKESIFVEIFVTNFKRNQFLGLALFSRIISQAVLAPS